MWYVLSSAFNKESWKKYELETKEFNTFDDARKYIRDKADKYSKFCMDEIGCDSYVEDYGDDVYFNFLGIRIDFNIFKAEYMPC